jgi:1A family penicillin-binding protein
MRKAWLRLCVWITLGLAAFFLGLLVFFPGFFLGLPTAQSIRKSALAPSSLILDRQGRLLYEIIDPHAGLHRPLELGEIPLALRQAIIATEDASFYRNPGVDLRAVARALWQNLRQREIVSGASTITQQLARNLLMGADERAERSWQRKAHESLLAYHITRTLSKDEILALYLNETYFGNMAYGVEAAARAYLGKPVAQLDLAESALLAGLPQSPADYNPLSNLPAAKERQQVVLALMVKAGYVTAQQAELAQAEALHFAATPATIEAPHFCALVRDELTQRLGELAVRQGGLRIHTTLDLDLQRAAEAEVQRHLAQLNAPQPDMPGHNVHNAAVVVLDEHNGAVRVMVGSPDYFDSSIDGAVNAVLALRQPGSAIKPITYAAAFARGYAPATMIPDVRTSFLTREGTPYVPVNYDYRFHGPVLLRQALACSYNVVAVKLLDRIGTDAMTAMARQLGITSLDQAERQGLALTLGSCEVQLVQLTAAYGALANGGWRVRPYSIDYIEDRHGHVVYRAASESPEKVLDERIAYLITDILADNQARVPTFGEGSVLDLPFPAAVKTGTTTEWRDNWTVGYTTELVTGVWVGNADNQPMLRASGVSGAAPIWNAVMRAAHRQAPQAFRQPAGLVEVTVCAESGLLPSIACNHHKRELFLAENVPTASCDLHHLVAFDKTTGQVALADCPNERRTYRSVTFWPPELLAWAEEEELPLPPDGGPNMALASTNDLQRHFVTSAPQQERKGLYLSSPDANNSYSISPSIPPRFQQIEVSAVCPPEMDLRQVAVWVDGQRWHIWSAPPYRVLWPLQTGMHEFWVEGADGQAQTVRSAPVRITVRDEAHSE